MCSTAMSNLLGLNEWLVDWIGLDWVGLDCVALHCLHDDGMM
jgi:hypothetical protein